MEKEGTTAIVRKYRQLVRTLKQTRFEQVILSGIFPVIGSRGQGKLPEEGNVGKRKLGMFCWEADMYIREGLRLPGKGAAVFADELSAAFDCGMSNITNILLQQTLFKLEAPGVT